MTTVKARFEGKGYRPLVDFGNWRVAVLNPDGFQTRESVEYCERHIETDEVFVLLSGKARLIDSGTGPRPLRAPKAVPLKNGAVYNVKKGTWHFILMSAESRLLIVENRNTTRKNSRYHYFSDDERALLRKMF